MKGNPRPRRGGLERREGLSASFFSPSDHFFLPVNGNPPWLNFLVSPRGFDEKYSVFFVDDPVKKLLMPAILALATASTGVVQH